MCLLLEGKFGGPPCGASSGAAWAQACSAVRAAMGRIGAPFRGGLGEFSSPPHCRDGCPEEGASASQECLAPNDDVDG
jgi:hypothetical protein